MAIQKKKGFTLIEVLVVIGIIAVLATIVLVAVNPTRQFKLARDTQRTANVNAILNAIHQNISEHKGTLVCNGTPRQLPTEGMVIAFGPNFPVPASDLASCLVPDYLAALPFDPSMEGAHYTSPTDYDTEYQMVQDENGRITITAIGELAGRISVTR